MSGHNGTRGVPLHVVVGMPRAATTWLIRRLNAHPDVVAFGESSFFGNRWVEPGPDGCYDDAGLAEVLDELRSNPMNSTVPTELGATTGRESGPGWMANIDRDALADVVDTVAARVRAPIRPGRVLEAYAAELAAREGASVAVEKTPHHLRHVARILAELPGCRVLVLVRAPEPFLLSYKHQADRKGAEHEWQRRQFHPVGVAMLWRSYARAALAVVEDHPSDALLLRTDDVAADPRAVLDAVWRHLGVAHVEVEVETRNNSSFAGNRPSATATERFWLWCLCRRVARRSGYDLAFHRPTPIGLVHSVVALGPWAWWNLRHVRARVSGPVGPYLRRVVTGRT